MTLLHDLERKAILDSAPDTLDPRVTHITRSLEEMNQNIERKMQEGEQRINQMLTEIQRPALGGETKTQNDMIQTKYHSAFFDYVRRGNDSEIRKLETKALQATGTGAEGGFLVSPVMSDKIYCNLRVLSEMRGLANIVTTYAGSVEFLIDPNDFDAGWVAETAARPETSNGALSKITIQTHEIYAMPKATQRLLDDSAFNIEEWMAERVSEKFARSEATAFISGDGVNKPIGFLTKTQVLNTSWSWGNIGFVKTGNASSLSTTAPHDNLIDLIYALKPPYRVGAVWLMNSKTAAVIRKVKDAEGRYLWNEYVQDTGENRLLGYQVSICEDMPDIGANTTPVAFGNFKAGYMIVDSHDMRILRDPYSAKPHIFFYVTKRVGGDVIDFDAIKLLKCTV